MKKFIPGFLASALALVPSTVVAFATESGGGASAVGVADYQAVLQAMTGQISISTIVAVLAASIGAAIGFVFLWWAVRKLMSTFFSGFRKGRASV